MERAAQGALRSLQIPKAVSRKFRKAPAQQTCETSMSILHSKRQHWPIKGVLARFSNKPRMFSSKHIHHWTKFIKMTRSAIMISATTIRLLSLVRALGEIECKVAKGRRWWRVYLKHLFAGKTKSTSSSTYHLLLSTATMTNWTRTWTKINQYSQTDLVPICCHHYTRICLRVKKLEEETAVHDHPRAPTRCLNRIQMATSHWSIWTK